jgi:hypothetical protein
MEDITDLDYFLQLSDGNVTSVVSSTITQHYPINVKKLAVFLLDDENIRILYDFWEFYLREEFPLQCAIDFEAMENKPTLIQLNFSTGIYNIIFITDYLIEDKKHLPLFFDIFTSEKVKKLVWAADSLDFPFIIRDIMYNGYMIKENIEEKNNTLDNIMNEKIFSGFLNNFQDVAYNIRFWTATTSLVLKNNILENYSYFGLFGENPENATFALQILNEEFHEIPQSERNYTLQNLKNGDNVILRYVAYDVLLLPKLNMVIEHMYKVNNLILPQDFIRYAHFYTFIGRNRRKKWNTDFSKGFFENLNQTIIDLKKVRYYRKGEYIMGKNGKETVKEGYLFQEMEKMLKDEEIKFVIPNLTKEGKVYYFNYDLVKSTQFIKKSMEALMMIVYYSTLLPFYKDKKEKMGWLKDFDESIYIVGTGSFKTTNQPTTFNLEAFLKNEIFSNFPVLVTLLRQFKIFLEENYSTFLNFRYKNKSSENISKKCVCCGYPAMGYQTGRNFGFYDENGKSINDNFEDDEIEKKYHFCGDDCKNAWWRFVNDKPVNNKRFRNKNFKKN